MIPGGRPAIDRRERVAGKADMSATVADVQVTADLFYANHIAAKDTLPTFAPGPALGGGAGVVLGSDIAMTLTMVSLGGPAGLLGTVQFGALWANATEAKRTYANKSRRWSRRRLGAGRRGLCRHNARTDPVFW